MPKQRQIHWRERDNKEIQRVIKNYNARLRTAMKQYPDYADAMPQKLTVKAAKQAIETRQDYNKFIDDVKTWRFERPADAPFKLNMYERSRLQTAKNNFESKRRRILAKNPDAAEYLPPKLTMKQLVSYVQNEGNVNELVNMLRSFSKKGAETPVKSSKGKTSTKWAVDTITQLKRKAWEVEQKQNEELMEKPVTIKGKEIGSTMGENVTTKRDEPFEYREFNFDNVGKSDWANTIKYIEAKLLPERTAELQDRLIQNYVKALIRIGADDETIHILERVPKEIILEKMKTDRYANIDFIYDPVNLAERLADIKEIWGKYATEEPHHSFDIEKTRTVVEEEAGQGYYGRVYTPYVRGPYKKTEGTNRRRRILPKDFMERYDIKEEE